MIQNESVLNEPPPRVLVDRLVPEGVWLRVDFWFPTRGVDGFKLNSDVRLQTKVALQHAGITPPITTINIFQPGDVLVSPERSADNKRKAEAAIAHDAEAARTVAENPQDNVDKQLEHAIHSVDEEASEDGKNLLRDDEAE